MTNRNKAFFFATSSLAAMACVVSPSTTTSEKTESTQSALLGDAAVIDTANTWSFGVCKGPLTNDADSGATGGCLTPGTRCTGTLVAPNLVLTAQHCVATETTYGPNFCDGSFGALSDVINVTPSDSVTQGTPTWIKAKKVFLPPAPTDTSDVNCLNDVALIELESNVPSAIAKPIDIDVDTDLTVTAPTAVTVVGRGNIEEVLDLKTFDVTQNYGLHKRRVLENIPFICAPTSAKPCELVDYTSPPANKFPLPGTQLGIGFGPASGDSGSGILDQASYTAKKPKVLGVVSAGTYDEKGIPTTTFGPRTSLHKAFLIASATEAATDGKYDFPVWAGGKEPEPVVDAGTPKSDAGEEPVVDAGTKHDAGSSNPADPEDDGGCSASTGSKPVSAAGLFASLGLVGLAALRRRKAKASV